MARRDYEDDIEDADDVGDMSALFTEKSRLFKKSFNPNRGRSAVMNTIAVSGGFQVQPTQLIADVEPKSQQWMFTIAPPMQQGVSILPWASTFDGTTTAPTPATFQAPLLPTLGLQCFLQVRAGAVSYQTAFDYPFAGAVFGIACDALQLDVVLKQGQSPITYAALAAVPVIGAFMAEGKPATQSPLRWMDVHAVLAASSALTPTYWPVRPFARTLDIYVTSCPAADVFELEWVDAGGGAVYTQFFTSGADTFVNASFDVPPTAVAWALTHSSTAGTASVQPVSEIAFS
jgi:hypothetical protein